jgi:hypothetical protein
MKNLYTVTDTASGQNEYYLTNDIEKIVIKITATYDNVHVDRLTTVEGVPYVSIVVLGYKTCVITPTNVTRL